MSNAGYAAYLLRQCASLHSISFCSA